MKPQFKKSFLPQTKQGNRQTGILRRNVTSINSTKITELQNEISPLKKDVLLEEDKSFMIQGVSTRQFQKQLLSFNSQEHQNLITLSKIHKNKEEIKLLITKVQKLNQIIDGFSNKFDNLNYLQTKMDYSKK